MEGIHARSEGNPFYAEQLLAAGAGDARALPATLAELLLTRVQGLSEPTQQVLRVATVAGRRVPHRLLAEVSGQPEVKLERGLQKAVGAGALTSDAATGSYAFRHALLQEAVYEDLLPGERVRLHAPTLACSPTPTAPRPSWPRTPPGPPGRPRNLLAKLGVHTRLEAAAMARRLGLEQSAGRKT